MRTWRCGTLRHYPGPRSLGRFLAENFRMMGNRFRVSPKGAQKDISLRIFPDQAKPRAADEGPEGC